MGKKRNRPGVAAPERKMDNERQPSPSSNDILPQETPAVNCGFIESILPTGKENAVSTADLLKITGLSDRRTLQQIIERERRNGALILSRSSSPGGYYLPANQEELETFYRVNRAKALSTLRTLKPARLALKDGQWKRSSGGNTSATQESKKL